MNSTDESEPLEIAVTMPCDGDELVGILHKVPTAEIGVLFVVGGNQYRVGSHRLFVDLARSCAQSGYACMRFDHRGIGDNVSSHVGFESLADDIEIAIAKFLESCPEISRIIIVGLCDGASAALLAIHDIPTIDGLVLVNPWVHSSELEARTRLTNYYSARLRNKRFWRKLFSGKLNIKESVASLLKYIGISLRFGSAGKHEAEAHSEEFTSKMRGALERFEGEVLIILSGQDLVAQQFQQLATIDKTWKRALEDPMVTILKIPGADHTFSISDERNIFQRKLLEWFAEYFA